ncbi:transglutaminaseTgpA domain-containing protein [Frankia sp. AgB32]|uniref:transglutaminaseTgpA domain-containing protein n=1 Tax=Frankia sp. AgB32 TaxID=631119 RepID=UPI00200C7F17|nr:transglutaminaseTgpA domain-containing protein [Frankia sp. AgB32]MCK9896919.1 transglutaminaseTgpA domain-containing protein [Frankia sp. AgB32]
MPTAVAAVACLLSTSALTRLFDGTMWWFGPVLIAAVVAVATAAVGRQLRLPLGVGLLLNLVGLVGCLTVQCARATAVLGVLPTPETASTLRALIADGGSDISRLATPVPHRPGLVILTVTGVYLTVVAVDLIVVALERPTLGGLPLLALYAVSAAILPGGVGLVPFVLGAVGFVTLMVLDGRIGFGRWGRSVPTAPWQLETGPPGGRITVSALGVALAALLVAVAVPAGLPSLDGTGLVSRKGGYGAGDGPSSASVVQPIVSVSQQLHADTEVPLLSVRTDTPRYLRLTALENFDGQLFTLRALNATRDNRVSRGLPKPDIAGGTVETTATITVTDRFKELYLPVPGTPTKIKGLVGDWRLAAPTNTIFSTRTSTAGAHYEVDAVAPNPTQAELVASSGPVPADLAVDTALPSNLDPRLRQLLNTITRNAHTPYERVYAIQEYLRGPPFVYDLDGAPTTQEGALSTFLFDKHVGYCEQFASAMTVLVRLLGVPARVAIGFVPGERQADGSYLVTNRQAHAWPEVWFPSTGWVSFEPTRRSDGATAAPSYAPAGAADPDSLPAPGSDSEATPAPAPGSEPVPVPTTGPTPGSAASQAPTTNGTDTSAAPSLPGWAIVLIVAAVLVLVLLAVPATLRIRRRRGRLRPVRGGGTPADGRQSAEQVHLAWTELLDVAADLGVTIRPSDSPRAGVARLAAYLDAEPADGLSDAVPDDAAATTFPEARAALGRLAAAEERARYAPPELVDVPAPTEVTRDVSVVAGVLWSVAPRSRRIIGQIMPPSVCRRGGVDQRDAGAAAARFRWAALGRRRDRDESVGDADPSDRGARDQAQAQAAQDREPVGSGSRPTGR